MRRLLNREIIHTLLENSTLLLEIRKIRTLKFKNLIMKM